MDEAEDWLKTHTQNRLHNKISSRYSSSTLSLNLSESSKDYSVELMIKSKSEPDLIENDKNIIQVSKSSFVDQNCDNIEQRKLSTKNLDKILCFKRMLVDGFAKIEKIFKDNLILNNKSSERTTTTSTNQTSKLDWTQNKGNYFFNTYICINWTLHSSKTKIFTKFFVNNYIYKY